MTASSIPDPYAFAGSAPILAAGLAELYGDSRIAPYLSPFGGVARFDTGM